MPDRPPLTQIVLAFAGIYIIWSTTFLAIALAMRSIPPFFSGAVRFLIAAALMYAYLRAREPRPFSRLNIGGTILCGVLLTGIGNGFLVWSQTGLPTGVAALFVGILPVLTLVLDWLFFSRRAPARQAALGVAIGLAGVIVLTLHTQSMAGRARPIHVLAVMTAETAWSLGTLLQRRYVRSDRLLNFSCLQMLVGAVFQFLMGLVDREWIGFHPDRITFSSVLAILYLVVFGSIIAVNCYTFLVAHVPAQKVTTYSLVNPVLAMTLGVMVLGEHVTPYAIASMVLVLIGVGMVLFQRPATVASAAGAAQPRSHPGIEAAESAVIESEN